jgi:2-polyprenyl-3-methyl-5-hydroxy-6-metoxy-1,4-benzoquinol methylase/predicted NUDIX family phosphoesterase/dephospho-CoA kinase
MGHFHTIKRDFEPYVNGILRIEKPLFRSRGKVEGNPNYKQVVSYIMIMYKGKLLRFTRHEYKRNRSLDLIDGKYSIGFGGHVQHEDFNLFTLHEKDSGYTHSVMRELREETGIETEDIKGFKMVGVLNDDSTLKGKCHFAFLHLIELANPKFRNVEQWVIKPELVSFSKIASEFGSYEYWSKLCLEHFFSKELRNRKLSCYIDNRGGISIKKNLPYLAVVGEIGSGKSQVCTALIEQYGYIRIPCSQILRQLMNLEPGALLSRQDLQDAGYRFINKPGAHKRFAKRIAEYIKSHANGKTAVIDGLRYKKTLIELQKELGVKKIPLIYVESNRENQYRNFMSRENAEISVEDFTRIVEHPVESYISQFLEHADIFIFNFGSLESLAAEVSDYLQKEPSGVFLKEAWNTNARDRHDQILRGVDLTFENITVPYFVDTLQKHMKYPNLRILDTGCGTGILTKILAGHAKHVVAIDHSGDSIEIARQYANEANIDFRCASAETFIMENHFDVVIANMSFHSIEDIEVTIRNIFKSLRQKGLLVFSLPHPRYYPERHRVKEIFRSTGYEYSKNSFHKIPFTISLEREPLPSLIPYFHRPWHYYENLISKTGFWLLDFITPVPNPELMKKYYRSWQHPHILLGTALKPDV